MNNTTSQNSGHKLELLRGRNKKHLETNVHKNNNNNKQTNTSIDNSVKAISLHSLDDDDFRNLLSTAAKPQYGSLQRAKKKSKKDYKARRLSDASGENVVLSTEADVLLEHFRLEAEQNQRDADTEFDKKQRTVNALMKEVVAISKQHHDRSFEPEKWSKLGATSFADQNGVDVRCKMGASSVEAKIVDLDQRNNNLFMNGSQKVARFVNGNSDIKFSDLATSKLAFIDDDDQLDTIQSNTRPTPHTGTMQVNGRINNGYIQGNSVLEIRALDENEEGSASMEGGGQQKKKKKKEAAKRGAASSEQAEGGSATAAAEKSQAQSKSDHGDNPFTYSSGQLRLYGNRQGSYDIQKPRVIALSNMYSNASRGVEGESQNDDYMGPAFINLLPSCTSSPLLSHSLQPAHYDLKEQFTKGYLQPCDTTALNPTAVVESEMANTKAQTDKCALAKKRKEKQKEKEARNVYVAESKDGYMGNLSTEEILVRIEGKNFKETSKTGAKGAKEQSGMAGKSGKKKGEKGKAEKQQGAGKRETASASKEASRDEPPKSVEEKVSVDVEKAPAPAKEPPAQTSELAGAARAPPDEEEHYVSAEEGVISNISGELAKHEATAEQSGTSSFLRELITDGANFRADDEPINIEEIPVEEEFIEVTARSKKKAAAAAEKRPVPGARDVEKGKGPAKQEPMRPRGSSMQLTAADTSADSVHHEYKGGYGGKGSGSTHRAGRAHGSFHDTRRHKQDASSSLQTSRATSPDRRGSQPQTGRNTTAQGTSRPPSLLTDLTVYSTGPQGAYAKSILSPQKSEKKSVSGEASSASSAASSVEKQPPAKESGARRETPSVSSEASGVRSWADIAKAKSDRASSSQRQRQIAAAGDTTSTASDHSDTVKKQPIRILQRQLAKSQVTQQGTEPSEGSSVVEGEESGNAQITASERSMVLNLFDGKRMVFQSSSNRGKATVITDRKHIEMVQVVNSFWDNFSHRGTAPVHYKDLVARRRQLKPDEQ